MGNIFGDVYNGISNALKNLAHETVNGVTSAFAGTIGAIKNAANATKNVALQAASEISLVLINAVKLLISDLQLAIKNFGKVFPTIVMDAINGLRALNNEMTTIISAMGYQIDSKGANIPKITQTNANW